MSMDFKILSMRSVAGGYQVAKIRSNHDQKEYEVHNRYGAWYVSIGSHSERGPMLAPEKISRDLPFELQAYKKQGNGKNVQAAPKKNLFAAKAAAKKNGFMVKAQKGKPTNKFMAKKA